MMKMNNELQIIKDRWSEENRLRMLDLSPMYLLFEKAQKDIIYLMNRLEAAERAAIQAAKLSGKYRVSCPHPLHEERQVRDKMMCPECGDESLIPKKGDYV